MTDPLAWLVAREGVGSAYAAARDGVDVLLRDRGLRRTSPELTAESLLRGAHASAVLEGSESTLEEIRVGEGDAVARAAVRLCTSLLGVVPTFKSTPPQALARLHTLAARGDLSDDRLGRPRDEAAAARLQSLGAVLLAETAAPAMLVAAIVHADLLAAAPFASHNGLVARAAERLVLVARGVDAPSVTVPEAGHLALRPAYESNLRGYRDGGEAGVQSWALYAAEAYAKGAELSPLNG